MTSNWLFWALAAALLAGTAWTLRGFRRDPDRVRARWLLGLRTASALLLAWIVLQPQYRRKETVVERPVVGVLVDASQSMNDGPAGSTRAQAARAWLESAAFRKARETCDFRYFAVGRELSEILPADLTFDATESRIGDGLTAWVRRWGREETAGIVLLSDGLDTGGGQPIQPAVPCWVLEVEPPGAAPSARVAVWQVEPPRRPVAGAETSVRVVLQAWGMDGRDVPVELWNDDRKIGVKTVRFTRQGEVAEAILPLKPEKPGTYAYEIRVADPAADPAAKAQPFVLTVRQEGRSVMLLSNTLGFESKFLRRAITTDRNVRLDSYARWPDGGWASFGDGGGSGGKAIDLSAAGLASRSAVVLADVSPDALTPPQWQALADYASRGGGLVVLGGPNLLGAPAATAALGRISPVPVPAPHRDGRFGVKLTDAGLRHPVFGPLFESVREFPALQGANLASGVAGNAQVLMETVADGQARPLVVVKQEGAGRIAMVLSDTLWRWRVASPGWTGRQSPYDTFWAQTLDWLAPDQEGLQSAGRIELTADRPFYRQGDPIVLQAEWIGKGAAPYSALEATMKLPSGESRAVAMRPSVWQNPDGRRVTGFRGELTASQTGVHETNVRAAWTGGEASANLRVAVASSPEERRGETPDAAWLKSLTVTGGGYFTRTESDRWLSSLPKPRRQSERETVTDIWNHPAAALALLGCLCAEWWLRRRRGLA
ncbi:MAG: hypothetical protein J0M04_03505 [Verrucomicrobia bacterium]|nr:hypothetical protein [Verrucomicrobiota bacterium]